jgi:hypothetical protein
MPYSLRGKNILVISPNEWGRMRVSKHHYAIELARLGNTVFFLNPPDSSGAPGVRVEPEGEQDSLFLVRYRPFFPTVLRFRFRRAYDLLMNWQISRIVHALGARLDVVWCFDPNLYSDLRRFGSQARLFHVVDQVEYDYQIDVARSADLVAAVAAPILGRFSNLSVPQAFVNHGLGESFLDIAKERSQVSGYSRGAVVRVGYVGNLFSTHLDREVFTRIIESHPSVEFHLWGPIRYGDSNVSGTHSEDTARFLGFLESQPNVRLRGVQPPARYSRELMEMDLFLMCYDVQADPNGGSNSHKLLEYLSTGRVVVSNRVSTYADDPDLIRMVPNSTNELLPELFASTLASLDECNRPELQAYRARFALSHSYAEQVKKIEDLLGRAMADEGRSVSTDRASVA